MKNHRLRRNVLASVLALTALALASPPLMAGGGYRQTNLVSDIPGLATHTDSNMVNPWGISSSPASPFWVSNAGTGTSTLYNTAGVPLPLVVNIPGPGGSTPGVPTGQVFNSTGAFNGDIFVFASMSGTIAGWRGALGTTAETLVNSSASGAAYFGIAIGSMGTNHYLYAADFGRGMIDVIPSSGAPALSGSFTDPNLPAGYAPFNIQNVGGALYVSYALKDDEGEEVKGAGNGFVDKYDLNGNLLQRFASGGVLNAPWAVTQAPASFGQFGGDILVGNFGDGTIHAFDSVTGNLVGSLKDSMGNPLVNEGLWGLKFGNGGNGGNPNKLYFAAGIDDEQHGLFGSFTPVPEPTTYALAGLALLGMRIAIAHRRKRREIAADAASLG